MNISKYLTTEMASVSKVAKEKGIDNSIPQHLIANAEWIGLTVYDPVIQFFKVPPIIWALYRCEKVNELVGGDPNSWHKQGAAIDLDFDHLKTPTNSQLFYFLATNTHFNKLIWEKGNVHNPGWVHVQTKKDSKENILTLAYLEKGKLVYKHFTNLAEFEKYKKAIYKV